MGAIPVDARIVIDRNRVSGGGVTAGIDFGADGPDAEEVAKAMNRASKFLRGRLGRHIELKFTPDLHFIHDHSFDEAAHMNALFARPDVARDLAEIKDREDDDMAAAERDAARDPD